MIGRKKKDSGFSMPDFDIIDKSLKAGWVKRLLDPHLQSWKTLPFSLLESVGGPLLFKRNFSLRTLSELPILPFFYRDVLSAWILDAGCIKKSCNCGVMCSSTQSRENIKLSMFQFKINHHILYTRNKLFKAKITDSDSCHVCRNRRRPWSICL